MSHTINQKAAEATMSNILHTDYTANNFRILGAIEQVPSVKVTAAKIAISELNGHAVHKGNFSIDKNDMTRYFTVFAELQTSGLQVGASK
jgi:hypothetical protein